MAILIAGDIASLPTTFYKKIAKIDKLVLVGSKYAASLQSRKIASFPISVRSQRFLQLFDVYNFQCVIYISHSIDGKKQRYGEMYSLQKVMDAAVTNKIQKFIYMQTAESDSDQLNEAEVNHSEELFAQTAENLCVYYREQFQLSILSVYVPYLYERDIGCFFADYFIKQVVDKQTIHFYVDKEDYCDFLLIDDLVSFLAKALMYWNHDLNCVYLSSNEVITYEMLASSLIDHGGEVSFEMPHKLAPCPNITAGLKQLFDWEPVGIFLEDLPIKIEKEKKRQQTLNKKHKNDQIKEKVNYVRVKFVPWLELLFIWSLIGFLNRLTGTAVQFYYVDFRLLMVIFMANRNGIFWGVLAAGIASLSALDGFISLGTDWQILFYKVENWVPFAVYFLAGIAIGFQKKRYDNQLLGMEVKQKKLEERYQFIYELQSEVMETNQSLQYRVLTERNGLAKAYDVMEQLHRKSPEEILRDIVPILTEVMENDTISIYRILLEERELQLQAHGTQSIAQKDISGQAYQDIVEQLSPDQVWFNREAIPDLPQYVFPLVDLNGCLYALIFIEQAEIWQLSMTYKNLFHSIAGIINNLLAHAIQEEKIFWKKKAEKQVRGKLYDDDINDC